MPSGDIFDIASWNDPLWRVMSAQAKNLQGIVKGRTVDLPSQLGGMVDLLGDPPGLIRFSDTPNRLKDQETFRDVTTICTLGPLADSPTPGRITGRDDRTVSYLITVLISLSRDEQEQEEGDSGNSSLLARKQEAFIHDFKAVFRGNYHLIFDGVCPTGLVDRHEFRVQWDPKSEWPRSMLLITCSADLYEY